MAEHRTAGASLRLLYVTLEYADPIFSGNGVLSRIVVRGLLEQGCAVTVVCGVPCHGAAQAGHGTDDGTNGRLCVHTVPVSKWGRLDRQSSWEEFGRNSKNVIEGPIAAEQFDAVIGVDWTSLATVRHYLANHKVASVFMCFRVFCEKGNESDLPNMEYEFYAEMERASMASAHCVIAISSYDLRCLKSLWDARPLAIDQTSNCLISRKNPLSFHVVCPALRRDMHSLALLGMQSENQRPERVYFTSCVRLSPEKNPMRFVETVEQLCGVLRERGFVPCLCGSEGDEDLAKKVKERLLIAMPESVIVDTFVGAEQMADIYKRTVLNFHPPLYDAYGMTVVEAAAFATPSLIHNAGKIGAADLLWAERGEILFGDLTNGATAAQSVAQIFNDPQRLAAVGVKAQARALSYDEREAGQRVVQVVRGVL